MSEYLDIIDRKSDYEYILSQTYRAEIGIRAIGLIYHDHSNDQKSYDNVFRLKNNIEYRLFSATHQYLLLLKQLRECEHYLHDTFEANTRYPFGNPYFETVDRELSSIFDSIVFHLTSVFDYLSHAVCYMYFPNKEGETFIWTRLRRKVRGDLKGKFEFCTALDEIDKRFVNHLYNYRSRLIHEAKDNHKFETTQRLSDGEFRIRMVCSNESLKEFNLINQENPENKEITLAFMSSWLIKQTFFEIEQLLDAIKTVFENNSHFYTNLANPKPSFGGNIININPDTRQVEPISKMIWQDYMNHK